MKLTNEQLQQIYFGALFFKDTPDGYLQSFQYNDEQMAYFKDASDFWYERCFASTSKTFEFQTKASWCSFEYKIIWKGSEDSIELMVDGVIREILYVKDLPDTGIIKFSLPEGDKQVVVYLPADATIWVRNFEIDSEVTPAQKNEKVLWLGDSITQGFGPLRSSHTYVCVANRILNYDLINQGIGGYIYDKNSLMDMGYRPDKIIVALGINQYEDKTLVPVEEYYARLHEIYGQTPVLCITPTWRGDTQDDPQDLINYIQGIKRICANYSNITVVDAYWMVPHLPEYYLDLLHPNVIGAELYGINLVKAIKENNF